MTGVEFQQAFGTELEQYDSRLPLAERDVFYWLNLAQEDLIRTAFDLYEEDQTVTALLRPLVTNTEVDPEDEIQEISGYSSKEFTFPSELQYVISVLSLSKRAGPNAVPTWKLCKVSQADDIYRLLQDPFNRSTYKNPLATIGKKVARVYFDSSFSTEKARFEYIKEPSPITRAQGSVLPEFVHHRLVQQAVQLYLQKKAASSIPTSST
jgi:hypothetical protein